MLSYGIKIMDLAHIAPTFFDTEHIWGRKLQTEKTTFEVCGYVIKFQIWPFCFYFSVWCSQNSLACNTRCRRYILQTIYWNNHNI